VRRDATNRRGFLSRVAAAVLGLFAVEREARALETLERVSPPRGGETRLWTVETAKGTVAGVMTPTRRVELRLIGRPGERA